jgi:hypothetical protein
MLAITNSPPQPLSSVPQVSAVHIIFGTQVVPHSVPSRLQNSPEGQGAVPQVIIEPQPSDISPQMRFGGQMRGTQLTSGETHAVRLRLQVEPAGQKPPLAPHATTPPQPSDSKPQTLPALQAVRLVQSLVNDVTHCPVASLQLWPAPHTPHRRLPAECVMMKGRWQLRGQANKTEGSAAAAAAAAAETVAVAVAVAVVAAAAAAASQPTFRRLQHSALPIPAVRGEFVSKRGAQAGRIVGGGDGVARAELAGLPAGLALGRIRVACAGRAQSGHGVHRRAGRAVCVMGQGKVGGMGEKVSVDWWERCERRRH